MPLTEKGEKIKSAMAKQYGAEKGKEVFYASKNKGTITGVDDDDYVELKEGKDKQTVMGNINKLLKHGHSREAAVGIAQRKARQDDNQHMGFSKGEVESVKKLVDSCDQLSHRLDMFEKRHAMKRSKEVKPRTKDNMQPSNRHPKEVHRVK